VKRGGIVQNKDRLNKLERDFFKSSTKIFRMDLDSSSIALFCYLSSCREDFCPSSRLAAKILGLHRATISKAFATLIERNVIKVVTEARPGKVTMYAFVNPEEWKGVH
jgi:hypothetical protein